MRIYIRTYIRTYIRMYVGVHMYNTTCENGTHQSHLLVPFSHVVR